MKSLAVRVLLGVTLLGLGSVPSAGAAEDAKALPTLMIKGEVVSLDSTDAAAPLLKVKDRYGFETPIYLSATTKITQGDLTSTASSLTSGAPVEVEYNFDVNTAKRYAMVVKLAAPPAEAPVEVPAATAAPAAEAPTAEPVSAEEPVPAEGEAAAPSSEPAPEAPAE